MKIVMVPGSCANVYQGTGNSFCESCFARFLHRGCEPNLACITAVEDEDDAETTLLLEYGNYGETVLMTEAERTYLADGGWTGWTEFVERAVATAQSV